MGISNLCHSRCEAHLGPQFTSINGALTLYTVLFLSRTNFDLLSRIYIYIFVGGLTRNPGAMRYMNRDQDSKLGSQSIDDWQDVKLVKLLSS